jgi:hypothetical protein
LHQWSELEQTASVTDGFVQSPPRINTQAPSNSPTAHGPGSDIEIAVNPAIRCTLSAVFTLSSIIVDTRR